MIAIDSISRSAVTHLHISRMLVWTLLVAGLVANLAGIVGGTWDGAFHARYEVDSFWSPPHLVIYGSIGITLAIGLAILTLLVIKARRSKSHVIRSNPILLITSLANLGFLVTGPFDELWHVIFGREELTVWTVPHLILNFNLVLTSIGVLALAVWLRAAHPNGSLAPAQTGSLIRIQNMAIFVGLSMLIIQTWGFLYELEVGDTSLSPIPGIGWLYPLLATTLISLCFALASQLLSERWWLAAPLVVLAQLWWFVPGIVLRQFGYQQVDGFRVTITLAGLVWTLIAWKVNKHPAWLRFAIFGVGFIAIVLIARSFGLLVSTSNWDVLLTAIFLPALAVIGGYAGERLAKWLKMLAGELSHAEYVVTTTNREFVSRGTP